MRELLRNAITLDPSRSAHLLRFSLVLLVKVALFALLLEDNNGLERMGTLALRDGDTWEYVDPIESVLAGGDYTPDHRTPGYGAVWFVLRSALSPETAASTITVLQLLLASIATYLLAWSILRITGSARAFWVAFVLLAISTYHAKVEPWVMNESFTTSALALHWIGFVWWKRNGRRRWLLLSGAALGWAVLMRPVYAPLLAVVPLLLFFHHSGYWRQRIMLPVFFLLPFLAADIPWAVRNHRVNHAFHPLTNGVYGAAFSKTPYYAAIKMLQSYGGNYNFWDPTADIRWFGFREHEREGKAALTNDFAPPPAIALIPGCTEDSLRFFAGLLMRARDADQPVSVRDSASAAAHRWADAYRTAYAQEQPFQYHIMAPLRYLKHITIHSGTQVLFSRSFSAMPLWQKAFKLGQSALYWIALLGGLAMALLVVLRKGTSASVRLLAVLVLYGVLAHPFLMRVCEVRYLIPTFPLMLVAAVVLFNRRAST